MGRAVIKGVVVVVGVAGFDEWQASAGPPTATRDAGAPVRVSLEEPRSAAPHQLDQKQRERLDERAREALAAVPPPTQSLPRPEVVRQLRRRS